MSFLTDLRAVSESAVEQLSARFTDLPRPLLAAIGAGDVAVERLAELRESLKDSLPSTDSLAGNLGELAEVRSFGDVRSLAADLPAKAQRAAAGVAGSLESYATKAPAKVQELVAELPEKVTEIAHSLSPDAVKQTVEAYTQLAGMIYGNLAERGEATWEKVVGSGLIPGTVVNEAAPRKAAAKPAAPKQTAAEPAPKRATAAPRATARADVKAAKPAAKPAARKAAPKAATPAAAKATPARPAARSAATPAAAKPAAAKPAAAKPAAPKPTPATKPAAPAAPAAAAPAVEQPELPTEN